MILSKNANRRIAIALASKLTGNEVNDAINQGAAVAAQSPLVVPALITATSTSTTVDFAALAVGDTVIHIPAAAGNSIFLAVVTAGTLPAAAVVGDLYLVLRKFAAPAASTFKF